MSCRKCLCRSCIHTCGCESCNGDKLVSSCVRYSQFQQISFLPPKRREKAISEYTWDDYKISCAEYKALKTALEHGKYQDEAWEAASRTDPDIAPYIIKTVRKHNGTYEDVEFDQELGRIPVCRTYFYGYRRRFYRNLMDILEEKKLYKTSNEA